MNRNFILTAAALLSLTALISSCGHSRVWANNKEKKTYAEPARSPRPAYGPVYTPAPLIVSPSPGFTMARHPNGQYYHRGPQGLMYWKGFDNRFYLDRNQVDKSRYSKFEYREWKRFSRHNGK